jgi:hypothetical protein
MVSESLSANCVQAIEATSPGSAALCPVRLSRWPFRSRRGAAATSQRHPRTIFRRALERGNLRPLPVCPRAACGHGQGVSARVARMGVPLPRATKRNASLLGDAGARVRVGNSLTRTSAPQTQALARSQGGGTALPSGTLLFFRHARACARVGTTAPCARVTTGESAPRIALGGGPLSLGGRAERAASSRRVRARA